MPIVRTLSYCIVLSLVGCSPISVQTWGFGSLCQNSYLECEWKKAYVGPVCYCKKLGSPTDKPTSSGGNLNVTAKFTEWTPVLDAGVGTIVVTGARCTARNDGPVAAGSFEIHSHFSITTPEGEGFVDSGSEPGADVTPVPAGLTAGSETSLIRDDSQIGVHVGIKANRVCLRCWTESSCSGCTNTDPVAVDNCSVMWADCATEFSDGICRTKINGTWNSLSTLPYWEGPSVPEGCQCPAPFPTDPAGPPAVTPTPTITPSPMMT
jgi:hypothetical protein